MPFPQDPMILVSWLNTQLRDHYASLELLCEDLQLSQSDICQKLAALGYAYAPAHNRFE